MINIDKKIAFLEKRTIKLLEKTKKEKEKYKTERKILFNFYENQINLEDWETYLNKLEKKIF